MNQQTTDKNGHLKCSRSASQKIPCIITKQIVNREPQFEKCHKDKGAKIMSFEFCVMAQIPSSVNILNHMPHLEVLEIFQSNLSAITKDDLEGFSCLTDLTIVQCNLEKLPGDLFMHTHNLICIDFSCNKIAHIDMHILDPLKEMYFFNLSNNPGIDFLYVSGCDKTLEEFKDEIGKCCIEHGYKVEQQRMNIDPSLDFTVIVSGTEFKVNKAMMAAKSKKFARFIEENPHADTFETDDIFSNTFQDILEFLNTGNLECKSISKLLLVFRASIKLEIDCLRALMYEKALSKVDPKSALDVLRICNTYGVGGELKAKAFEEYKKNFPSMSFSSNLISISLKLRQLMHLKEDIDKLIESSKKQIKI